jgi:hypothetical protein
MACGMPQIPEQQILVDFLRCPADTAHNMVALRKRDMERIIGRGNRPGLMMAGFINFFTTAADLPVIFLTGDLALQ